MKPGELYKSPADPFAPPLKEAIEEPGVFAGYSAKHKLPILTESWPYGQGFVWCPLQNRVDLDNVRRQIATSGEFQEVRCFGYAKSPFKENPWQHMNPFKTKFSWKGIEFTCGITDHENRKPSTCGARVYLQGKRLGRLLQYGVEIDPAAGLGAQ